MTIIRFHFDRSGSTALSKQVANGATGKLRPARSASRRPPARARNGGGGQATQAEIVCIIW